MQISPYARTGNVTDSIFTVVMLLTFAISVIAGYIALYTYDEQLRADNSTDSRVTDFTSGFLSKFEFFDYALPMLYIGLLIVVVMLNNRFPSDPMFLIVYYFFMLILIIVAAIINNVWIEFSQNSVILSYSDRFPITDWMLTHSVLMSLLFAAVSGIVLYSNRGRGGASLS